MVKDSHDILSTSPTLLKITLWKKVVNFFFQMRPFFARELNFFPILSTAPF